MTNLVDVPEELQPAYAKTLLPNVIYKFPEHKLYEPRHRGIAEAEQLIVNLRAPTREGTRQRLAVSIHEAGHKLEFQKFGISTTYLGQGIYHVRDQDRFLVAFGQVGCPDEQHSKLSVLQFARCIVAGRVAEKVILGKAPTETSECDYEDFVGSGRNGSRKSQLILVWKLTEEKMLDELHSDIAWQQKIIHEAARFEAQVFGLDRSVKAAH
jgi:hypothetical protein